MDIQETFLNHQGKKELPQKEREAKQKRWSDLHYKLNEDLNLSDEERQKLKEEKEALRKEIT